MIQEFWHVFTDPAHALAEVASSIVIDGLFLFVLYQTLFKKYLVPKWHKKFDKDHGIEHSHEKDQDVPVLF